MFANYIEFIYIRLEHKLALFNQLSVGYEYKTQSKKYKILTNISVIK